MGGALLEAAWSNHQLYAQKPFAKICSCRGEYQKQGLADKQVHIAINALQRSLKDVVGVLVFGALNNFAFQLLDE